MVIENESDFLGGWNFGRFDSRSSRMNPGTAPGPNTTVLIIWEHHDPKAITMYRFEKNKFAASRYQENLLDRLLIHRNHLWTDFVVRRLNPRPEGSVRSIRSTTCRIRIEKIKLSMIWGFEISREHISIIDREVKVRPQRGLEALITTRNVRVGRAVSWYCM